MRLQEHQHVMEAIERYRLPDEIQGTQAQAFPGLTLGHYARYGDDRQARFPNRSQLEKIEAAHAGKMDVEDDRVRAVGLQLAERGLRAAYDDGLVTELAQKVAKNVAQVDLVFDDQDAHLPRQFNTKAPMAATSGRAPARRWGAGAARAAHPRRRPPRISPGPARAGHGRADAGRRSRAPDDRRSYRTPRSSSA